MIAQCKTPSQVQSKQDNITFGPMLILVESYMQFIADNIKPFSSRTQTASLLEFPFISIYSHVSSGTLHATVSVDQVDDMDFRVAPTEAELDDASSVCRVRVGTPTTRPEYIICTTPLTGRYVRAGRFASTGFLCFVELEISYYQMHFDINLYQIELDKTLAYCILVISYIQAAGFIRLLLATIL